MGTKVEIFKHGVRLDPLRSGEEVMANLFKWMIAKLGQQGALVKDVEFLEFGRCEFDGGNEIGLFISIGIHE